MHCGWNTVWSQNERQEVSKLADSRGWGWGVTTNGHEGSFWGDGNVQLDWVDGHAACKFTKSLHFRLKTSEFYDMYIMPH